MGSRAKHADRIGKMLLALGAAACALAALTARADCRGLFDGIELTPELRAFLEDPKIQTRIASFGEGREPFASFYSAIEAWLTIEKNVGRASRSQAKLRVPGGEPLLHFYKRNKYQLAAKLSVDKPGEVSIVLDLGSAHVPDPAAILELQTLELSVVNRLFAAFSPGELKKVTLRWKLGQNAPRGFGDHMISLGFAKSTKFLSRCSVTGGIAIAFGSTLFGASAGGFLSIPADYTLYYNDNPHGRIVPWAIGGGLLAGLPTTLLICRKPSVRGGAYELAFIREAEKI